MASGLDRLSIFESAKIPQTRDDERGREKRTTVRRAVSEMRNAMSPFRKTWFWKSLSRRLTHRSHEPTVLNDTREENSLDLLENGTRWATAGKKANLRTARNCRRFRSLAEDGQNNPRGAFIATRTRQGT